MEHIALAPAAIAAPVAEHIAPVSAVVAAPVSARCSSGALAHMERRCELEVRRGWCCWTCVASSWPARPSRGAVVSGTLPGSSCTRPCSEGVCTTRDFPLWRPCELKVAGERPTLDCDRLGSAAMLYCFVHVVPAAVVVSGARASAPVLCTLGQFLLSGSVWLQCTRII